MVACALLLLGTSCATLPPAVRDVAPPARVGTMPHPLLPETSGLAPSRRADDLLWAHNDSDNAPVLFALGTDGRLRGQLRPIGATNVDWEDIASFEAEGRAWLLVADVGDNASQRTNCVLYVLPEPDPAALAPGSELPVGVAWRIPVRYPDGPRDCEAVAVDPREGLVYLISKRTVPAVVYTLPLHPSPEGTAPAAAPVARLTQIPQPIAVQKALALPTGKYRAQPTGLDFSPDGTIAAMLTYGDVWLFRRPAGQSWTDAFASEPQRLPPHGLMQAEAVCFSRDGRALYVSSEGRTAPLLRYDLTRLR
jgi:hypothetical protein